MGCAFAAAAPTSHATHYRINALVKHSRQPLRPVHCGVVPTNWTVPATRSTKPAVVCQRVTVHLPGDGGIHGSPAKSWARASMAEMPFLRVVDR